MICFFGGRDYAVCKKTHRWLRNINCRFTVKFVQLETDDAKSAAHRGLGMETRGVDNVAFHGLNGCLETADEK